MARVRFTLSRFALQSGKVIASVREVFGNRLAKYANAEEVIVECSADRFARWLIARDAHGAQNSFKDLKLEMLEPSPYVRVEAFD